MHDDYVPHCSYCKHFKFCFRTDMVTEWGYCSVETTDDDALQQELETIKQEIKEDNFQTVLTRADDLGLFVPKITSCQNYDDLYPI